MAEDFLQLAGKRILLFGVANRKSVAYHVAQVCTAAGAHCIYLVKDRAVAESVLGILPESSRNHIFVCDLEREAEIQQLREQVAGRYGTIHGLVHSVAMADYSAGRRPFHETPRGAFLRTMDISCYSLVAISREFKDLFDPDASVVTISISTTRMAAENYGYMAPVKAALESSLVFLAKSFSRFSRVRFNAVAAGLLKTSASAGIPGYVDAYLFAEQVIPRKKALQTEEVAHVVAFLLSPRSSGINAQRIVVDAGMSINYFDEEIIRRVVST